MKQVVSKFLSRVGRLLARVLSWTKPGRIICDGIISGKRESVRMVTHNSTTMAFVASSELLRWRTESFSSKEPETLTWIDSQIPGSVFWDIGSNVGLYSVYAAKARYARVFSFEPSAFNLEALCRNISLNHCESSVTVIPIAASNRDCAAKLDLTSSEWGGSMATFGEGIDFRGLPIKPLISYEISGLRLDSVSAAFKVPQPLYLKIDVDGIEHRILEGAEQILSGVRSVLVEINDDFLEQRESCAQLLTRAGLVLEEIGRPQVNSPELSNTKNQIWVRP